MNEHYVDDSGDLDTAVQRWRQHRVIGLDTEFIRTRTFYPIPALYQVATPDATYLVDPLPIDRWDGFADLLCDPDATIVMHACSEDLEVFARHLQIQPAGLFDTQVAEGFLGPDFSLSYAALVARYGGATLAKQATRSDWLAGVVRGGKSAPDARQWRRAGSVLPVAQESAALLAATAGTTTGHLHVAGRTRPGTRPAAPAGGSR
jgi:ribonuclease D